MDVADPRPVAECYVSLAHRVLMQEELESLRSRRDRSDA
jgi:hypothetical protein